MNRIPSYLINELKNKSSRITNISAFLNKSWTFLVDGQKMDFVSYLFKKDNRLIVKNKSNIQEGTWEFIEQWGGLILEFGNEKNFYGQAFAFQDQVMLLVNENEQNALLLTNDAKIPKETSLDFLEGIVTKSIEKEPRASEEEIENQIPKEDFNFILYVTIFSVIIFIVIILISSFK